jgi:hypothetical protein
MGREPFSGTSDFSGGRHSIKRMISRKQQCFRIFMIGFFAFRGGIDHSSPCRTIGGHGGFSDRCYLNPHNFCSAHGYCSISKKPASTNSHPSGAHLEPANHRLNLATNNPIILWMTFSQIKEHEANQRMQLMQEARKSKRAARALQKRVSLVGSRGKWRITNLAEVAEAMSKWA